MGTLRRSCVERWAARRQAIDMTWAIPPKHVAHVSIQAHMLTCTIRHKLPNELRDYTCMTWETPPKHVVHVSIQAHILTCPIRHELPNEPRDLKAARLP